MRDMGCGMWNLGDCEFRGWGIKGLGNFVSWLEFPGNLGIFFVY